jgi:pilus assembly protein CpaC
MNNKVNDMRMNDRKTGCRKALQGAALLAMLMLPATVVQAQVKSDAKSLTVPVGRSVLVTLPAPMTEVMVANPSIADVHAHDSINLSVVAKKIGHTNVRIFGKEGKLLREFDVIGGHDLPAIRRALKNFLPDEKIGVEMVNTSVALTGQISNATAADKAVRIVQDFIRESGETPAPADAGDKNPSILNLMQVVSGQQVMLRVRVGEINREALKNLGMDVNGVLANSGAAGLSFGSGAGLAALISPLDGDPPAPGAGSFVYNTDSINMPSSTNGAIFSRLSSNGRTVGAALRALERDGLFKILAEPNLVAISGEGAEFLAGGEIPVPTVQNGGGSNSVSIEYKPFGVAVKFTPFVLSENRIRMAVQPEVSEISTENAVVISGFSIPSISTRRAKTTVELAPGESFMIAGLIKDQMRARIDQLPGVKELPVLGALFRSTEFQRNETEMVIAVTPFIVDPLKSSDVKLPTDDFRPASQMEMFFYGALGSLSGNAQVISQSPGLEGPIGFMVD